MEEFISYSQYLVSKAKQNNQITSNAPYKETPNKLPPLPTITVTTEGENLKTK